MSHPALEVADVIRQCGSAFEEAFGPSLSLDQRRVLREIASCRTAALGGHVQECDGCGHRRIAYNSCRNRHCPKCQAAARGEWLEAREQELLPAPYFHVVFTLPHELGHLAWQNKKVVYGLLFRAAAATLLTVAADPQHLGAKIGFLSVLHTWGQNLMHHPHLHVVVPGGGLSPDGSRWIACKQSRRKKEFFLPVRVLSRVFRGKFLAGLKQAHTNGKLEFHGQLQPLAEPGRFNHLLNQSARRDWIVYAKRPFGGPRQVLKYLARYTHRVAIANSRLVGMEDGRVQFRWKDYADNNQHKTMTLEGAEFLRRFLLHVLPRGFSRIRYYGLLSNRGRHTKLQQCRQLLGVSEVAESEAPAAALASDHQEPASADPPIGITCPACQTGRLIAIEIIPADKTNAPPRCPPPHFLTTGRQGRIPHSAPIPFQDTS